MSWSAAQYMKFHGARLRPALDLLNRSVEMVTEVPAVKTVLDLGCGPGNITPFLAASFPSAIIEGVDSSAEMIQKARAINDKADYKDRISFRMDTIEAAVEKSDKQYDVVFCNAALHWCVNHDTLIPKLLSNMVAHNGGILAIQMPDTRTQPSHLLMETAALRTGNGDHIRRVRIPRVDRDPSWYFSFLSPIVKEVDMWATDYVQQLETSYEQEMSSDNHPVLEFTKGTGLLPVIEALGGEQADKCQKFLKEYNRMLHDAYPTQVVRNKYHAQGKLATLMPFKRFFLVCKT